MVRSSNTIDFTGFPPVRRSTSGVLSVNAERLHTSRGNPGIGTAYPGNPDDIVGPGENRPGFAAASWHPGILKASDDQPAPRASEGAHLVSRDPGADGQRVQGEPGAQPGALLLHRC